MAGVLDNCCPKCGAAIKLDIKSGLFKCDFCRSEFDIDSLKSEASKTKVNKDESQRIEYDVYKCPDCGAQVVYDDTTSSTCCLYCRNSSIIKSRLEGKFAPDKIILFKKEKKEAMDAFKCLKKGRPFAPKYFFSEENVNNIQAVYIPFWLYDYKCEGNVEGKAVKETSWSVGDTRYTKKDTYEVARGGEFFYDKVPVDGANKFDNDIMNSIEPFDYSDLIEYNHAYLSGFLAEMFDVDSDTAKVDAEQRVINTTKFTLENSINKEYTSKTLSNTNITNEILNLEYVLLPVYMVSIKYKEQLYIFAMNGQTGKFVGNIPIDKKKQAIIAISLFVIVFAIVVLISYLIYII